MTEVRADNAAALRLTESARRVLRAIRLSKVDDAGLVSAAERLDGVANLLESELSTGPLWITGLESFDEFELTTDIRRMFPYSPATGVLNPIAPRVSLDVTDAEVRGTVTFPEIYNGPPFGFVHGGAIAMVYDELLAAASIASDAGGYTGRLTVHYRKTTPLLVPIDLHAWVDDLDGRKFTAHGEMRIDGELLSEGEGLFIRPKANEHQNDWAVEGSQPGELTG